MKRPDFQRHTPINGNPIAGLIVAGGRSRRMGGGDKCLLPICGQPMLGHVIDRFAPQVDVLALNANGDPSRLASFGLPVIDDEIPGRAGPLAGLLTGMRWAARHGGIGLIATVPGDTPFIPRNLLTRLFDRLGQAELAIVRSRGELHPVIGLWRVTLADDLARWLHNPSKCSVKDWVRTRGHTVVEFDNCVFDPFFNVNTPKDLLMASQRKLK